LIPLIQNLDATENASAVTCNREKLTLYYTLALNLLK